MKKALIRIFLMAYLPLQAVQAQGSFSPEEIEGLKNKASELVQERHKQSQVMVDKIFSFAELGFQEIESSNYLTGILEENGFEIERGI